MAKTRTRAANEGSIFQRKDGRWVAQVTFYDEDGRRQRRGYYFATQAEARKKLTSTKSDVDRGVPVPVEMTLAAHFTEWLATKEADLRPESLRRYRDLINLHLIPTLGRVKLTKLTAPRIHAALAECRAKGLSGTTLQLMHGVLHKALDDAVDWNRVVRNEADRVKPPRRSTPEMRTLTPEEAAALLIAAEGDPLEAFYTVALTCGLRLGELQALRWRDVDLDRRRLQVTATFQGFEDGAPVFAEPKTENSKRTVHLSEMASGALRAHRTRQIEARLKSAHYGKITASCSRMRSAGRWMATTSAHDPSHGS